MSADGLEMGSNGSFDPFAQNITLLDQTGAPFNITIGDLDDFYLYSVQICINYAAQLGGSLVLLVAMALLTRPEKRLSPIFVLNGIALAANFVRLLLLCLFYTGPLSEPYAYFAFDYSRVPPSAFYTSVTAETMTLVTLILVEISLLLQVQVVCITVAKVYRYSILAVSIIIGTLAVGFRLALCIVNNIYIMELGDPTSFQWLDRASIIVTTISVCWFCLAFVTKLGLALLQRKRLGLRRWSPMHVLFIMGCQTLVIPGKKIDLYYKNPIDRTKLSSPFYNSVSTFLQRVPIFLHWLRYSCPSLPCGHHRVRVKSPKSHPPLSRRAFSVASRADLAPRHSSLARSS